MITDSSKDYSTGVVTILWDNDRPTDEEFLSYVFGYYGDTGTLEITGVPNIFKGFYNPGTATVTPVK